MLRFRMPGRAARKVLLGSAVLGSTVAMAGAALASTVPAPPAALMTPAGGSNTYWQDVCGRTYVPVDLGRGDYFNVYNATDGQTCVDANKRVLNFFVSKMNRNHVPWDFVGVSAGIWWSRYTCGDAPSAWGPGSTCMRFPVQVKNDGMPFTSYQQVWPHLVSGNVAYDIWFNKEYVAPSQLKQNDGAEVMIWNYDPGVNSFIHHAYLYTTWIGGHEFDVCGWRMYHNGKNWLYTAYVSRTPLLELPKGFWLNEFFRNAEYHGRLSSSWWLTAIDFGEEINQPNTYGPGFAVRNYTLTGVK